MVVRKITLYYYEDDSAIWHAHPAVDENYLIPIKGIDVLKDSVYVKVPFVNGKIWYEGLFINDKSIGVHKIYYQNGSLKGVVDYENKTIMFSDSTELKLIRQYSSHWKIIVKQ